MKLTENQLQNMIRGSLQNAFAKNLSSTEIDFLEQRLEKGIPIDKMSKDKIIHFKKILSLFN